MSAVNPQVSWANGILSLTVTDGGMITRQYQLAYRDQPSNDTESAELTRIIHGAFNAGMKEKAREVRNAIGASEPR